MKSNMAKQQVAYNRSESLSKQLKRMEALSVQKCSFARVSTREGGLKVIWAICASSSQSPLSNTR